ncbi:MAG: NAD(P)/FAD-dependent oxidoreductase [Acidobacteria bacterium]|nr:NAD(P)/FAD-dependent oxidoreductase [Acidobacteriota bacterium]
MTTTTTANYDALVIGGGPAGSTAATVLAMHGRRVALVEREPFPRYHIGESLLPYCYFTLDRLGLIEKMKQSHFPKKYSVQFVSTEGKLSVPFYFFQHWDHEAAMTWQVLRSDFDRMLLDNARERSVEILQQTTARELLRSAEGVVTGVKAVDAAGDAREFRATITIDATGRDAFAVSRNGWKVRDPYLNKIAIWTYFEGAKRDEGLDEGATTVAFVQDKGWFWYIPLPNNMVSVGIVAEKDYLYGGGMRELSEIFAREVAKNPWIAGHTGAGKQTGEYWVTGEFSYRSRHCAEDGLVLTGDAFAFLDPVFSSGVFLALKSGEMAGDAVEAALAAGDVSAGQFTEYGAKVCEAIEAMRKLVYSFYNERFSFKDFLMEFPHMKGDLTECLIGNLFRDFDPMFNAMTKFADIPAPLPHGAPLERVPAEAGR